MIVEGSGGLLCDSASRAPRPARPRWSDDQDVQRQHGEVYGDVRGIAVPAGEEDEQVGTAVSIARRKAERATSASEDEVAPLETLHRAPEAAVGNVPVAAGPRFTRRG